MALVADPVEKDSNAMVLATAGYDHMIRFWETLSGSCHRILQHPESQVNALSITRDKRFLAAAGNPYIQYFDAGSLQSDPLHMFEGHSTNVTSVGFPKDSRWMYSGSEDGTIKIWDTRTPKCQRTCDNKKGGFVHSVVLHPNQAELYSADQSGTIRLWDLSNNSCSMEITVENSPMKSISITSDGSLMIACNHMGNLYAWNLLTRPNPSDAQPVAKIKAHPSYITKCLPSPDGNKVVTASADHTIKIWNTSDFSLERVLIGHQKWVWDCAFSADSAYLISVSSDHSARLWDVRSGEALRHYVGHDKAVVAIALNDLPVHEQIR